MDILLCEHIGFSCFIVIEIILNCAGGLVEGRVMQNARGEKICYNQASSFSVLMPYPFY